MDCLGAQGEADRRPGGPSGLETARRDPPWFFYLSLVLLASLLALPGLPGDKSSYPNPSSYFYVEACLQTHSHLLGVAQVKLIAKLSCFGRKAKERR